MNPSGCHINRILLLAIFALSTVLLKGQGNCLTGCKKTVTVNGKKGSFGYQLIMKSDFGNITWRKGKYLLDLNEDETKKRITIKITSWDLPPESVIVFSRNWSSGESFTRVPFSCKKVEQQDAAKVIVANLNASAKPSKSSIRFAIINDKDLNCRDITPSFQLDLPFTFGLEEIETEVPTTTEPVIEVDPEIPEVKEPVITTIETTKPETNTTANEKPEETKPEVEVIAEHDPDPVNEEEKKNPPKEKEKPKPTEEDLAMEAAYAVNSREAFINFRLDYPDSEKYGDIVDKEIAIRSKITPGRIIPFGSGYKVKLENVLNITVDSILYSTADHRIEYEPKPFSATMFVDNIAGKKNIRVILFDLEKPDSTNNLIIPLGDHLDPLVKINEEKSEIERIDFEKGQAPYKIFFVINEIVRHQIKTDNKSWEPEPGFYKKNNLYGEVYFQISDARLSVPYAEDDWKINVPKKSSNLLFYLGGLAILLLGAVLIYPQVVQAQRKRNHERYKEERASRLVSHLEKITEQTPSVLLGTEVEIEEGGNEFVEEKAESVVQTENSKIKIKKIKKAAAKARQYNDEKELEKILVADLFLGFDTNALWEDTAVSQIFFNQQSIEKLDGFLTEQNLNPLHEQEGQIPEIGGILLGRPFWSETTNSYRILVEEFVPIDPEYHDRYQLEFSAQSMAKDLGDIQDQFPELMLVGWFHTHPGHGLFLFEARFTYTGFIF